MSRYTVITDSSADLTPELVEELKVEVVPLSLAFSETEVYRNYPDNRELDPKDFYRRLRAGEVATTAALNIQDCRDALTPILERGEDVLVLSFSSGLSTSYQSFRLAAQELEEEYPGRKVYVVDSLCASLGQGLFVYHVAKRRDEGATLEELRDYAQSLVPRLCHWFTVDDLHFLKRGGRVSAATAVLGSMLQIKPVLHVDGEGHLTNVAKARGRQASIRALVDKCAELADDPKNQTMFICHGDCLEDAQTLAEMVRERFGTTDIRIGYTGTVIGAHSGPGTLALFFLGQHR